mmetsp:Transcript_25423/g.55615  ORF Transcript_25423/g.55615 Transcript_25423/m.55615 type:complete len:248 (-) Transcript_25423:542-1285(-)
MRAATDRMQVAQDPRQLGVSLHPIRLLLIHLCWVKVQARIQRAVRAGLHVLQPATQVGQPGDALRDFIRAPRLTCCLHVIRQLRRCLHSAMHMSQMREACVQLLRELLLLLPRSVVICLQPLVHDAQLAESCRQLFGKQRLAILILVRSVAAGGVAVRKFGRLHRREPAAQRAHVPQRARNLVGLGLLSSRIAAGVRIGYAALTHRLAELGTHCTQSRQSRIKLILVIIRCVRAVVFTDSRSCEPSL